MNVVEWANQNEGFLSGVAGVGILLLTLFLLVLEFRRGRSRLRVVGFREREKYDPRSKEGSVWFLVANVGDADAEMDDRVTDIYVPKKPPGWFRRKFTRTPPKDWAKFSLDLHTQKAATYQKLIKADLQHQVAGLYSSSDLDLVVPAGGSNRFIGRYVGEKWRGVTMGLLFVKPFKGKPTRTWVKVS